jgi:hypothetical protein
LAVPNNGQAKAGPEGQRRIEMEAVIASLIFGIVAVGAILLHQIAS